MSITTDGRGIRAWDLLPGDLLLDDDASWWTSRLVISCTKIDKCLLKVVTLAVKDQEYQIRRQTFTKADRELERVRLVSAKDAT